jgi:hypothetical protein
MKGPVHTKLDDNKRLTIRDYRETLYAVREFSLFDNCTTQCNGLIVIISGYRTKARPASQVLG